MKVLFIGDVFGHPGRSAVKQLLPEIKDHYGIDFTVANAENAAGGFGITPDTADDVFSSGVDVITLGNHVWDKPEAITLLESDLRVLRPANYPEGVPGRGSGIYDYNDMSVAVINLTGRVYMKEFENPFSVALREVDRVGSRARIILVDMHAEVTSEKVSMGWHLDGRVSAVVGTHTHIQTADERVLPQGTAYITDLGMTGPQDSVIGIRKEIIIQRFLTQMPVRFEVASENVMLCGVVIEINETDGRARSIERLRIPIRGDRSPRTGPGKNP